MNKEPNEFDLMEIVKLILNKRKTLLITGVIAMACGLIIAYSIPNQYQTKILFTPDQNSDGNSLGSMGALAGIMSIDLQTASNNDLNIELYPEIITSSPFLMELADTKVIWNDTKIDLSLYITRHQKQPWWNKILNFPSHIIEWFQNSEEQTTIYNNEDLKQYYINTIKQMISVDKNSETKTRTLYLKTQSALISYSLIDTVYSKLQKYVRNHHTLKSSENLNNAITIYNKSKEKFYVLDDLYAKAHDRNMNPLSKKLQSGLERIKNERDLAFSIYTQHATNVEQCKIKIVEQTPFATVLDPALIPLKPTSPNKKLIIFIIIFLAIMTHSLAIIIKHIYPPLNKKY